MARRLFDFFAAERVDIAREMRRFFALALLLVIVGKIISVRSLAGEVHTLKTDSIDQAFLSLPAYDVEFVDQSIKKPIRVGDSFVLQLVGLPAELAMPLAIGPADASDLARIQEEGWTLLGAKGDSSFLVVVLKPGKLTLPSLLIKDSKGASIGRTNPFVVDAETAIRPDDPKPEAPVGSRPPVGLHFPWQAMILVAGFFLLVLVAVLYALVRWSRGKRVLVAPQIPSGPPKTPDESALEAFAELEEQALMKRQLYKNHYFGISEILKRYLGERYEFDALESTTHELMQALETKTLLTPGVLGQLKDIFEALDQVKFTDFVPSIEEGGTALFRARDMVNQTKKPKEA
jgi:hypothetical protein